MTVRQTLTLHGIVLDERVSFTLETLAEAARVDTALVLHMVDEGLLQPQGGEPKQWRFAAADLRRAQIARRLQHDLAVNLAGAALALDLLEEIKELRTRVECLEYQLLGGRS